MIQRSETRTTSCPAAYAQPTRWLIATAAALMHGAVGAIYAWSVFRDPLMAEHGWTIPDVTLAYSLNLFGLGIFAFVGGLWMQRVGPRTVGLAAGLLGDRLWALYVGFGVVAGIGRGLGWVAPMATAVQWFPDRRGLICGVSLAGNGLGALIAAPLATALIERIGVLPMFTVLGALVVILVAGAALALHEPPEGYRPPGWEPPVEPSDHGRRHDYTVGEALRTPQWYGLWALLFVGSSAGLALFSHAAPMARELTGVGAMTAAGLVGMMSLANASGRLFWAWLSDLVGRGLVFSALLVLLAAALRMLPFAAGIVAFGVLAALAMLCFGGVLGTMPAFAADYFGPKHVGPIMGLLMTAQGTAAMVGPMLMASARETSLSYEPALSTLAVMLVLAAALPLALRPPIPPAAVVARVRAATPVARSLLVVLALAGALVGSAHPPVASATEQAAAQSSSTADLAVAQTGPTSLYLPQTLSYTVTVTNQGSSTATIIILINPARDGTATSTARVVADEPDPISANNTASATTTVYSAPRQPPAPSIRPPTCPRLLRLAPESRVAAPQDGRGALDEPDGRVAERCSPV